MRWNPLLVVSLRPSRNLHLHHQQLRNVRHQVAVVVALPPDRRMRLSSTRQENEVISTVVNKEKINKARAIAGIEGIAIKDIIDKGLDMVIKVYEEKHGPVRPRRPKKKGDVDEVFGV